MVISACMDGWSGMCFESAKCRGCFVDPAARIRSCYLNLTIAMKRSSLFLAAAAAIVFSVSSTARAEERKHTAHHYAKAGDWKIFTFADEAGKYVSSRAVRHYSDVESLRVSLTEARDTIDFRGPGMDAMKGPFQVSFWFSEGINSTTEEEASAVSMEAKIITADKGKKWARIVEPKTGPGSIQELAKAGMIHFKFNGKILHYDLTKSASAMKILLEAHHKKTKAAK